MSQTSMLRPNGINHLALSTANMKTTLTFFNEVLGMPLAALYWMHGAEQAIHGFFGAEQIVLSGVCIHA
ncbi:VOC family protein [Pseudomaricurvus hydrocarbonicus]|uniref:VOC family protein n=1 Tax=Pseudomaricurvus hydrocarbonicus TaxID=1470433 RepID=UPI00142164C0|nr:VOC family protein [Aestuariicella hydrocarbonica]